MAAVPQGFINGVPSPVKRAIDDVRRRLTAEEAATVTVTEDIDQVEADLVAANAAIAVVVADVEAVTLDAAELATALAEAEIDIANKIDIGNAALDVNNGAVTIDGGMITAETIVASDVIVPGTITANEMAANSIVTASLVANAITTPKLATDAIKSLNYDGPDGAEVFSDAGSFFDLSTGDLITPGVRFDSVSGDTYVRGDLTASSLEIEDPAAAGKTITVTTVPSVIAGGGAGMGLTFDHPSWSDVDTKASLILSGASPNFGRSALFSQGPAGSTEYAAVIADAQSASVGANINSTIGTSYATVATSVSTAFPGSREASMQASNGSSVGSVIVVPTSVTATAAAIGLVGAVDVSSTLEVGGNTTINTGGESSLYLGPSGQARILANATPSLVVRNTGGQIFHDGTAHRFRSTGGTEYAAVDSNGVHIQTNAAIGVVLNERQLRLRGTANGERVCWDNTTLVDGFVRAAAWITGNQGVVLETVTNARRWLFASNGNAYAPAGFAWTNFSSRTLKDNIEPISPAEALEHVLAWQPVTFTFIEDEGGKQHEGFIAEDMAEVTPNIAVIEEGHTPGLDYGRAVVRLAGAVQELTARLAAQDVRIAELEAQLAS